MDWGLWGRRLLWGGWLASFALGLLFMAIFAQGIWRDQRIGEPVLGIDFSRAGGWSSAPFRVLGAGQYTLFVSSVNHDRQAVGAKLQGDFELAITDPDGKVFFQRVYPAGSVGHAVPSNYGDTKLASFSLDGWSLRSWTLKARVLKPDPAFHTTRSEVKFWKQRYDPGMGGLINYVMIIPAMVFLVIAFILAAVLAARGAMLPIVLTAMAGVAMAGLAAL